MTQGKHTPGPWHAERQDSENGHIYWAVHADADYEFVVNFNEETPCAASDARLIAAAPDLLTALDGALKGWLATWLEAYEIGDEHIAAARFEKLPVVVAARAALAKARGQ